ncbi:hypothetical protein L0F63_005857 [Massospora cicadina]|nr:hypothetical protein L0F63_005857 [Massospora cicadina]
MGANAVVAEYLGLISSYTGQLPPEAPADKVVGIGDFVGSTPAPELIQHLLSRVCLLLSTNEDLLWVASVTFLFRYISKLRMGQLARDNARLVAYMILASIQTKAAAQLQLMLESAHIALATIHCLWKGPPGPNLNGLGALTTLDMIRLFQEVTEGGKLPVHFVLHPLYAEVKRARQALSTVLLSPDGNYPTLAFALNQADGWRLQKMPSWIEIEQEAAWVRKTGYAGGTAAQLDDLIHSNASPEVISQFVEVSGESLLASFVRKVERVCRDIQRRQDFVTPRAGQEMDELAVPSDTSFFEALQELGEQLYVLVSQHQLKYGEVLDAFLELVEPPVGKPRLEKDNTLLWLILQLFHLDQLRPEIAHDFSTTETQFQKLIRMYNHTQAESVDAYHLRDLALQCALIHQQESILDRASLKPRHPRLVPALKYSHITLKLHNEFIKSRELIGQVTLFDPATPGELVKLGVVSQMRQGQFPPSLFVNLMPAKSEYDLVLFADCTCILGGTINYRVIDQLPTSSKQQLMNLIFTLALNPDKPPPASTKSLPPPACVPPAMVDTIFRLIYSAPHALEVQIGFLLHAFEANSAPSSPAQMRWYATILQLFNYRLLRHFSNHPSLQLMACLPLPQQHPQLQIEAEELTVVIISLVTSLEQLQAFDLSRPALLFSCCRLAHMLVRRIAAIILRDGVGPHGAMIAKLFSKLPPLRLAPSAKFPLEVASYFRAETPSVSLITLAQARDFAADHPELHEPLLQGGVDFNSAAFVDRYASPESQAYFMPMIWGVLHQRGKLDPPLVGLVRSVLARLGPASDYQRTCHLLFAILAEPSLDLATLGLRLDELIFTHQLLVFSHVLFALSCDGLLDSPLRFDVIKYLLFGSPGFKGRYALWEDLDIDRCFWREGEYSKKHCRYLTEFPEFNPHLPSSNLPCMPSYFGNTVLRTVSSLEHVLGAWIDATQFELLETFLTQYPHLLKHHQLPLTTVLNILYLHWNTSGFTCALRLKLVHLLDLAHVPFTKEFQTCLPTGELTLTCSHFEQLVEGLARAISPTSAEPNTLLQSPQLPERHYREFSNPIRHILAAALVELLCVSHEDFMAALVPCIGAIPPERMAPKSIHAIGILLAHLPFDILTPLAMEIWNAASQADLQATFHFDAIVRPFSLQNAFCLNTPLSTLASIFHSTLHFSGAESLKALPPILDHLGACATNASQFNFMLSLVGPCLFRMVGMEILDEVMHAIAKHLIQKPFEPQIPLMLMDLAHYHHLLVGGKELLLLHQLLLAQGRRDPVNPLIAQLLRLFDVL